MGQGVEARVYMVRQRPAPPSYFVVTFLRDRAVAVQLLGPPAEMPLTFSSLLLGAAPQRVLDVLGWPGRLCRDRSRGRDLWYYPPFPVAVEFEGVAVTGFKVTVPADQER